ncbi:uncharacterized protein EV154DRAFT_487175 [Mucor mucedo]|uniref:uncharacterized protein n=1 Tax=Mucor mucedo TaxID=29922 RepID=UPI00221EBA33|nr:uncharacterized protein EV154DRAFT_487175 [Mucor mucedo]KAI7873485.1 hypothetical protein EV154DRAFT_487175 [Mucor mucedo]
MWQNRLGLRNTLVGKMKLKSSCVKSAKNDAGRGRTPKPRFQRPTLYPLGYDSGGVSFQQCRQYCELKLSKMVLYDRHYIHSQSNIFFKSPQSLKAKYKDSVPSRKNLEKRTNKTKREKFISKVEKIFYELVDSFIMFRIVIAKCTNI